MAASTLKSESFPAKAMTSSVKPMLRHLFVYGTLRASSLHPMARRLAPQAKLIGTGTTRGTLYDLGTYPGAMFGPEHASAVVGDVFALNANDRFLGELDAYEGTAETEDGAMYEKVAVEVRLHGGRTVLAMTYALRRPPPRPKPIRAGDWMAHLRSRRPL